MQGKISDFSIPDIFQLVSSQQKSGALKIRGDEREIVFLFADGKIVDVQPDRRPNQMGLLGNMLVDAGYLTEEEMRRILGQQEKKGKKLGEILVEEGKLSRETLNRYLYLQIKESLFFALRIKEGDYKFEGYAVRPPSWSSSVIRPDILMMEGMQFLDEYPMFREKFPSGKFHVSKKPSEMKFDVSALSEEERTLWKNIDFSPDPWRIFRKTGITWFEGIKTLSILHDRGLIRIFASTEKGADDSRRFRDELEQRKRIEWARGAVWGAAFFGMAWWIYGILFSSATIRVFADWARFF